MRAVTSVVVISSLVFVGGLQAQQSLLTRSGQLVRVTALDCGFRRQNARHAGRSWPRFLTDAVGDARPTTGPLVPDISFHSNNRRWYHAQTTHT